MMIKVNEQHEDGNFIITVWNLLEKVCLRTGMTIEPIYAKDVDFESRNKKDKHYLVSCLEDVRKKIQKRNVQNQINSLKEQEMIDFDLEKWTIYQLNNGRRKLLSKNRKSRQSDADKANDEISKTIDIEI